MYLLVFALIAPPPSSVMASHAGSISGVLDDVLNKTASVAPAPPACIVFVYRLNKIVKSGTRHHGHRISRQ